MCERGVERGLIFTLMINSGETMDNSFPVIASLLPLQNVDLVREACCVAIQRFFISVLAFFSVTLIAACAQAPPQPSTVTMPPTLERELTPSTSLPVQPPTQISSSASWIEVDLAKQTVVLHAGDAVIAEYLASTGVTSDPKYATPPGLYRVQSKEQRPIESVPGVFVTDLIMFDIRNGNGIHSRPMDDKGKILEATLGQPATAGCVRVGESARVFEFAQLGMWVWIH